MATKEDKATLAAFAKSFEQLLTHVERNFTETKEFVQKERLSTMEAYNSMRLTVRQVEADNKKLKAENVAMKLEVASLTEKVGHHQAYVVRKEKEEAVARKQLKSAQWQGSS